MTICSTIGVVTALVPVTLRRGHRCAFTARRGSARLRAGAGEDPLDETRLRLPLTSMTRLRADTGTIPT